MAADFALISDLLIKRIGLDTATLPDGLLKRAVEHRMAAAKKRSVTDYVAKARQDPKEFRLLSDELLVLETWFFREAKALNYLVDYLTHEWRLLHSYRKARILSLPCSTGEEPYSIAMALLEGGWAAELFHLDAMDISERAIQQAKRGIYSKQSFRNQLVPNSYFTEQAEGKKISAAVRKQVTVRRGNALELDDYFQEGTFAAIFCQNLLIYMAPAARERLLTLLTSRLEPGGLLFVAAGEASLVLKQGYKLAGDVGAHAFSLAKKEKARLPRKTQQPKVMNQPESKKLPTVDEIELMADKGMLEEAWKRAEEYLAAQPDSAEVHYLMGLICHARKEDEEALRLLEKALYLDPQHHRALVYLSLLESARGDESKANNYRARLKRLEQENL